MAKAKGSQSGRSSRADPDVGFSFQVEIDGIRCGKFREARGLEWRSDPVQFYEGGNNTHKVSLIGPGSFTPLVLKKGFFSSNSEFFDWMKALLDGGKKELKRVTVSVLVRNEQGSEISRFDLFGAFMTRYAGPGFNGMDNQVAVEEIEIQYDRFEYKKGG